MRTTILSLLVTALLVSPAAANSIADAVESIEDGRIYLEFASRPGVYGDGKNIITHLDDDDDWRDCEEGPVRAQIILRRGEMRRLKVGVGGQWRGVRDDDIRLGEVPVSEAREYFLRLARTASEDIAEDAVLALSLADDEDIWRDVLGLARDKDLDAEVRDQAVFWTGQLAAEAATAGLETIIDDDDEEIEIRESAVFALSQRPSRESLPALTRLAKTHEHPQIRRSAIFWLAQHDDPEVLDLFEEILLDR